MSASNVGEILKKAIAQENRLPLWITHLWQRRVEHDRLGLVLGAGVSYDAGCPMWETLLERLTVATKIPESRMALHKKARLAETFLAEILFRKHSADETKKNKHLSAKYKSLHVDASWRAKIHKCLYKGIATKTFANITKRHIYLMALAELLCKSRFAVTFNFDDIIDEAVTNFAGANKTANPEIIVRPKVETRKDAPVIYHINGILPREELRRSSEKIVLTEDAFADIMLSPNSQDAEFVINQFAVRTFLLIGISLSDNSLKNLLRSSANRNPANHHFIIFHENEKAPRSAEERADIFGVNLHVYNLISIFLTTKEIGAFIEIINSEKDADFDKALGGLVTSKIDRKYYLVGSVAAGKSATLEALRCFTTHEEWSGRVPAAMYQNDKTLTPRQQKQVDNFLYPQLVTKNNNMIRMSSGIRVMDRAYLDLFAFSKNKREVSRKAKELKKHFENWGKPFEEGQIFFLKASEQALEERLARRGNPKRRRGKVRFDAKALLKQETELASIYRPIERAMVDTTNWTAGESAKRIARIILLESYSPFDFGKRLAEVISKDGEL